MVYNLICHVAFINTSEILNFESKEGFCAYEMHVQTFMPPFILSDYIRVFINLENYSNLQEKQNSFREHVHPFIHSRSFFMYYDLLLNLMAIG